ASLGRTAHHCSASSCFDAAKTDPVPLARDNAHPVRSEMIQLHYYPSTAAMVPHILLEEIGARYERVLVDRTVAAHKRAGYLQLNPNGLIPVLTDGDLVLYETAAIMLHLCDTHPASR